MVKAEVKVGSGTVILIGLTVRDMEFIATGRAFHAFADSVPVTVVLTGGKTNQDVEANIREGCNVEGAGVQLETLKVETLEMPAVN